MFASLAHSPYYSNSRFSYSHNYINVSNQQGNHNRKQNSCPISSHPSSTTPSTNGPIPKDFILNSTHEPSSTLSHPTGSADITLVQQLRPGFADTIAGAVAGAIVRLFVAPLDVIKIRFQVQTPPDWIGPEYQKTKYHYSGIADSCVKIYREEGFRAFFKGNASAEGYYGMYSAVQFTTYGYFHNMLTDHARAQGDDAIIGEASAAFTAGAMAALVAQVASYPMDLLRTRFAGQPEPRVYKSMADAFRAIWHSEGAFGFYAGLTATCIAIVPGMAIQFSVYESLMKRYGTSLETKSDGTWIETKDHRAVWIFGALSGIISKIIVMPLDVLKKRYQIDGYNMYAHKTANGNNANGNQTVYKKTSFRQIFKSIWRNYGWKGFYNGVVPSVIKAGMSAALMFGVFERVKQIINSYMSKPEIPVPCPASP